tara:strand:+ start:268 stop:456 length:189 start_codon:yes stop_codon:yes gene_type:complete
MQIITVNDDKYVIRGTVSADKVTNISTNNLKKRYSLADTVLRNGNTFYICMKVIEAEFKDIN